MTKFNGLVVFYIVVALIQGIGKSIGKDNKFGTGLLIGVTMSSVYFTWLVYTAVKGI